MNFIEQVAAQADKLGEDREEAVLRALELKKKAEERGKVEFPDVIDNSYRVHNQAPLCWYAPLLFLWRIFCCCFEKLTKFYVFYCHADQ